MGALGPALATAAGASRPAAGRSRAEPGWARAVGCGNRRRARAGGGGGGGAQTPDHEQPLDRRHEQLSSGVVELRDVEADPRYRRRVLVACVRQHKGTATVACQPPPGKRNFAPLLHPVGSTFHPFMLTRHGRSEHLPRCCSRCVRDGQPPCCGCHQALANRPRWVQAFLRCIQQGESVLDLAAAALHISAEDDALGAAWPWCASPGLDAWRLAVPCACLQRLRFHARPFFHPLLQCPTPPSSCQCQPTSSACSAWRTSLRGNTCRRRCSG